MKNPIALEDSLLPENFRSIEQVESFLSTPSRGLIADFAKLQGDIAILGVGGKVGPTLAMMAKRAAPHKRVIGVARFSDKAVRERLEAAGVECISCELLDRSAVAKLPEVPNIVFMAGKKFGTSGGEAFTWAMNAVVPSIVAERFPQSRFVGFSTLCVYPFAPVSGAGTREDGAITPLGEYANSCVARERVFQYYSQKHSTPGRMVRLNYAIDVRYGVLHDIGQWVWKGQAIDIRTPVANCIWQGDAISHILRCLLHGTTPSTAINIGAPQTANVRAVAERFGVLFGKKPIFVGQEESTAWHNDCSQAQKLFGNPVIDLDTMIRWNADWIMRGGESHNKPTHYEERAGQF